MRIIITFICVNAGVILTIQSEQGVLMKSEYSILAKVHMSFSRSTVEFQFKL